MGVVCTAMLALAACPGQERTADTAAVDSPAITPGTAAPGTMPGTTAGTPGAGQTQGAERIEMRPLAGSNISGEASLTPQGSSTQVMVRLTGAQQGQMAGHIHTGTCDNIGPVAFPLEPINAQQDGTSTSTINASGQQLMGAQHVIAYHEPGSTPGRPVTCGEIRGQGTGTGGAGGATGTTRP